MKAKKKKKDGLDKTQVKEILFQICSENLLKRACQLEGKEYKTETRPYRSKHRATKSKILMNYLNADDLKQY